MELGAQGLGPGEFELSLAFSLVAHAAFAVSGALAAVRRGYDFVGVIALALITAGGGGMLRDSLLSRGPAVILTDVPVLVAIGGAAVLTIAFHRVIGGRAERAIAVVDALGLGAFAVVGVQRSMEAGVPFPAVVLGGVLTAAGGGLLRDVLVREEPLLFKPGQFYALVAIGGCLLYAALLRAPWISPHDAALLTIALVTAVRLLAIRFNWQTRAFYQEPARPVRP